MSHVFLDLRRHVRTSYDRDIIFERVHTLRPQIEVPSGVTLFHFEQYAITETMPDT
jgi:hypothetical protein